MPALTIAAAINAAPPATAAGGILVFPVSPVLAWLVFGGLLAVACAILGWLSEPRRRQRQVAPPRRWRPVHPHPSRT